PGVSLTNENLSLSGTGSTGNVGAFVTQGTSTYTGTISGSAAAGTTIGIGTTSGSLIINGTIDLQNSSLTFNNTVPVTVASTITTSLAPSSNNAVIKNGSGTLTLLAANTYAGVTSINAGILDVANSSGLGSTSAGTVVKAGASLILDGGLNIQGEAF